VKVQPANILINNNMSLPGPFPVSQVQPTSLQELPFHLYERITAQVTNVSGTQAVLEINGYPVVARLTSKDQAAELLSRRSADFIITQLSADQITLKFVNKNGKVENRAIQGEVQDLAKELSKSIGLQGTEEETTLIRAALKEHLPITRELVNLLLAVVNDSGIDPSEGMMLAVKLKAAGLPVTSTSLQLVNQFREMHISDAFSSMINELQNALAQADKNSPMAKQIQSVLSQLEAIIPDLSSGEEKIGSSLQELLRVLGKSYENLIKGQMASAAAGDEGSFNLLDVVQLAKNLRQIGNANAADGVDRFLEQVRQSQFFNIKPDEVLAKGQWSEVNFMVKWPDANRYQTSDAKVRVSYRQEKRSSVIDPEFTNLILQVDLEPAKEIMFNLSLYLKKITAEITSPDPVLTKIFQSSMTEFNDLLKSLGYDVIQSSVRLKEKVEESSIEHTSEYSSNSHLDIEV
jgi:hypothetical protein